MAFTQNGNNTQTHLYKWFNIIQVFIFKCFPLLLLNWNWNNFLLSYFVFILFSFFYKWNVKKILISFILLRVNLRERDRPTEKRINRQKTNEWKKFNKNVFEMFWKIAKKNEKKNGFDTMLCCNSTFRKLYTTKGAKKQNMIPIKKDNTIPL